jgi:hypothetical protein
MIIQHFVRFMQACLVSATLFGSAYASTSTAASPAPSPRPSPVHFSAEAVTPIVRNTLIKSIGIPVAGGIAGGALGFFASKWVLKSVAAAAAKKWLPVIIARGTGTILGAIGTALLVNYFMDRNREAHVRNVRRGMQTPAESHPEHVTDTLPRNPEDRGAPGFEDLNLEEDFPR